MVTMTAISTHPDAGRIPYVTSDEAYQLMKVELDRFIDLVETLQAEEWEKPTACSEWDVRDILAHQAGGYASGTSYGEMIRQVRQRPQPGQLMEDAINAFQLRERAEMSPAELIMELRKTGPVAAHKWAYQFKPVKWIKIPHRDIGTLSLRHLMLVIHSRDTWMHRLDICRATGRQFEQTADHDGRIVELVMRDVAGTLERKYHGPAHEFELTGIAGGRWQIGRGAPASMIKMDVLEFNNFASGRYSYQKARPMISISGDISSAEKALQQILVLY